MYAVPTVPDASTPSLLSLSSIPFPLPLDHSPLFVFTLLLLAVYYLCIVTLQMTSANLYPRTLTLYPLYMGQQGSLLVRVLD